MDSRGELRRAVLRTDRLPAAVRGSQCPEHADYGQSYDGVDVEIVKTLSHAWIKRAAFGYQDWRQRVGPGAIVNPNDDGSNTNGPSCSRMRNGSSTSAAWSSSLGISASANFFGRQGYPVGDYVRVVPPTPITRSWASSSNCSDTPTDSNSPVYQLDLQVSTVFRIGSAVSVFPSSPA